MSRYKPKAAPEATMDLVVLGLLVTLLTGSLIPVILLICSRKKNATTSRSGTASGNKVSSASGRKSISQIFKKKQTSREYPRAPPVEVIPLAPARDDDDTLRDVQSLKKDENSDNKA